MTYTVSDLNEPVELEAPEKSEPFDFLSLLTGGAALGGVEGGLDSSFDGSFDGEGSLDVSGVEDFATELEGLSTDEEFLKSLEDLE